MVFPRTNESIQAIREAFTVLLREEVIIFSWCSRGLSLIQRNLYEKVYFVEEEFLHNGMLQKIFQKTWQLAA